jgi:PKD repeat protein
VRRILALAAAALVLAPATHAAGPGPCGVTTTVGRGAAPLTVSFTATCSSGSYEWQFGDGAVATGQTVQHVFAAGAWYPKLTTDLGTDSLPPVTSISVSLAAPPRARYAQWVTLRAHVTPRVPVTLRGRRFVAGKLHVRVLSTAPWIADALGVRSAPVRILVTPRLVVRTVGSPTVGGRVRVVASLHPSAAGRLVVPKVDTRHAHVAHVTVTSRPRPGWAPVSRTVAISIVQPNLTVGSHGPSVWALERRLADLHYAVHRDGSFGDDDVEAIYAFQKVEGLPRTGSVDASLWSRLERAHTPSARYGGDHIEVDKTRQVLFVVRSGRVALIVAVSTGATGNTPLGLWHVYRKVQGFDWVLYYPNYFLRGFAVHGYPDVPPYPASHGCVRIPMWIATTIYSDIAYGSAIYIYL